MPLTFQSAFLLIALGVLLIPGRSRRVGLVGLVPLGLGVAATTVRLGGDLAGLALRAAERSAPLRFLEINTGLILLGLGLVVASVMSLLRARQPSEKGRGLHAPTIWIAVLLVGGGAAPMLAAEVPLLSYINRWSALGAAVGIAVGAIVLFVLGRLLRLSRGVAWLDTRFLERNPPALIPAGSTTFDLTWVTGFFASAIIMGITPSVRAFALATVVAGTVGHVLMRRLGGGSPIPVTALASLFILPVHQAISTIVGDTAPIIAQLANGPVSLAAEYRIVLGLAVTAWGMAGLWPFHGLAFPLVAPLSGILLIRLGAHALPAGLEHWAPAFMPLALLSLWHVVASNLDDSARPRRLIEMAVALAFLGAFSGEQGVPGAYWLLGSAALVPWLYFVLQRGMSKSAVGGLLWFPLVWGALLVITGGLAAQVTYTVLAAGGIAAAIWVYHSAE
jgi:hypothetical protein